MKPPIRSILIVLLLSLPLPVAAARLELISQTYSIGWSYLHEGQPGYFPFSASGSTPVDLADLYSGQLMWWDKTYARGSVHDAYAVLEVAHGDAIDGESIAQMHWRPSEDSTLTILVDALRFPDSDFSFDLEDLTTGTELFRVQYGPDAEVQSFRFETTVNASHIYSMTALAIGDGDRSSVRATVTLPDHASSGSLLLLSLLGLIGLRRAYP